MLYHLSDSWTADVMRVIPKVIRADDPNDVRDCRPCIAVCPTILQCVLALGAWRDYDKVGIYATSAEGIPATWVFDYSLTEEQRIYEACVFTRVGGLDLSYLASKLSPRQTAGLVSDEKMLETLRVDKMELTALL